MRDFITIFRNDEVSDNVIKMINQEVTFRKKMEIKGLKAKSKMARTQLGAKLQSKAIKERQG